MQKTKLILGTVQIGMNYGLHNSHGQPTTKESFSILDTALAAGLTTFDTAWGYGAAEDVLGAWIKERSLAGKVNIISKMKPHAFNDYPDGAKASDIVRMEIEKSLQRLGIESLDGYLFHSPYYIYLTHMVAGLEKARDAGMVKNIGVSTYDEAEAIKAADLCMNYVQVPYNAFDQRLDATRFFEIAQKNSVTVFARSPFLQGLLLMEPSELPKHLRAMRPHLKRFRDICAAHHLSPIEAALQFVDAACRADYIVFGVDTLEQLTEGIRFMNVSPPVSERGWITEMREAFKDLNRGAIDPSLWSKMKQ